MYKPFSYSLPFSVVKRLFWQSEKNAYEPKAHKHFYYLLFAKKKRASVPGPEWAPMTGPT